MNYFITGGSGFIGRRLIKKLFQQHPDCTVYFLMRASHQEKLSELFSFWNVDESRAVPVYGDMTQPLLGGIGRDTGTVDRQDRPLLPSGGHL